VDGYGQYCPIALAAEVFAERWTPIVLRNLGLGCERFGEILQGAPGLSRSVLSQRLRRLQQAGVVAVSGVGQQRRYRLTEPGRELVEVVLALGRWGARWLHALPAHHDPALMLWALAHLIDGNDLPRPRLVIRFEITDHAAPHRFWLVVAATEREVCVTAPGFAEDGVVVTDARSLYGWHSGQLGLGQAERVGAMRVDGPRWVHRLLAGWGRLSPFADITPSATPSAVAAPGSPTAPATPAVPAV
jgi:DNA-binding HxlR family transcriptional regulator